MKKRVVCLLDQTGSMVSKWKDTIGGFNVFLKEQKAQKGELRFSLTLFNSLEIEKRYVDKDIQKVEKLTEKNYVPIGATPLWDAIGQTIRELKQKKDLLFIIITDGEENMSKEYTSTSVKNLMKDKEKKQGWKFMYLGVGLKDFLDADKININVNMRAMVSSSSAYPTASHYASQYRAGKDIDKVEEQK